MLTQNNGKSKSSHKHFDPGKLKLQGKKKNLENTFIFNKVFRDTINLRTNFLNEFLYVYIPMHPKRIPANSDKFIVSTTLYIFPFSFSYS